MTLATLRLIEQIVPWPPSAQRMLQEMMQKANARGNA
jgi:hypothetical protein